MLHMLYILCSTILWRPNASCSMFEWALKYLSLWASFGMIDLRSQPVCVQVLQPTGLHLMHSVLIFVGEWCIVHCVHTVCQFKSHENMHDCSTYWVALFILPMLGWGTEYGPLNALMWPLMLCSIGVLSCTSFVRSAPWLTRIKVHLWQRNTLWEYVWKEMVVSWSVGVVQFASTIPVVQGVSKIVRCNCQLFSAHAHNYRANAIESKWHKHVLFCQADKDFFLCS